MVRINLIEPRKLADQHLIAEYNEILMLFGHVNKFPKIENLPTEYNLGKGHIKFFKNKLEYLRDRHDLIKDEMQKRGFNAAKTINLEKYGQNHKISWKPGRKDKEIIIKRLIEKIKLKPNYYRYYGEHKPVEFFVRLIKEK